MTTSTPLVQHNTEHLQQNGLAWLPLCRTRLKKCEHKYMCSRQKASCGFLARDRNGPLKINTNNITTIIIHKKPQLRQKTLQITRMYHGSQAEDVLGGWHAGLSVGGAHAEAAGESSMNKSSAGSVTSGGAFPKRCMSASCSISSAGRKPSVLCLTSPSFMKITVGSP